MVQHVTAPTDSCSSACWGRARDFSQPFSARHCARPTRTLAKLKPVPISAEMNGPMGMPFLAVGGGSSRHGLG